MSASAIKDSLTSSVKVTTRAADEGFAINSKINDLSVTGLITAQSYKTLLSLGGRYPPTVVNIEDNLVDKMLLVDGGVKGYGGAAFQVALGAMLVGHVAGFWLPGLLAIPGAPAKGTGEYKGFMLASGIITAALYASNAILAHADTITMMCHAIQQTDMATKDVEAQRFLENAQTAQSNEDRAANTDALDRAVHTAPPPAKKCRHEHGEFKDPKGECKCTCHKYSCGTCKKYFFK